ncbi:MAG: hypothetical protein IC227_01135 [Enterococcus lacertideformus]|uniref:Uncharacterized protein n=1 Tax=Enterococcus lacertideformus TaxID=2771493 RepID=A0A931ATY3_9ENTE|nr:hypothetical protein [Enterococcus lacertideformus]
MSNKEKGNRCVTSREQELEVDECILEVEMALEFVVDTYKRSNSRLAKQHAEEAIIAWQGYLKDVI